MGRASVRASTLQCVWQYAGPNPFSCFGLRSAPQLPTSPAGGQTLATATVLSHRRHHRHQPSFFARVRSFALPRMVPTLFAPDSRK